MLFALSVLAMFGASAESGADGQRPGIPSCVTTFFEESERGDRMMAIGQYDLAADAYETAQRASCSAVPAVLLYGPRAEAECRSGRIEAGQALLADYACILAVVLGELTCDPAETPSHAAAALTERCRETMCGETPFQLQEPFREAQLDALRLGAQTARVACHDAR